MKLVIKFVINSGITVYRFTHDTSSFTDLIDCFYQQPGTTTNVSETYYHGFTFRIREGYCVHYITHFILLVVSQITTILYKSNVYWFPFDPVQSGLFVRA